jgi:SpoIIAA-like
MIKLLEGFSAGTVAVACEGHVTREDYEKILIPRVNEALARHDKVRIYYEVGPSFSGIDVGAVWEDTKVGFEHLARWERMALVTDVGWIRLAVGAFRFLMPGRLRVFDMARAAEARSWIEAAA